MIFKRVLFIIAASFVFITSTSGTTKNVSSESNGAEKMSLTYVSGDVGTSSSNEKLANLFDGSTTTKWCSTLDGGHYSIIFSTTKYYTLSSYSMTTANDSASYSSRNWKNWKIYGGKSSSGPWANLVNNTTSTLPSANYTKNSFTDISSQGYYNYFLLDFYTTSGNMQQLSELELYGYPGDTPMTLTYQNKGDIGTCPTGQTPDKLVDGVINDNNDKWCSYYNASAPQNYNAIYKASEAFTLTHYVLRTGGDTSNEPCRNWDEWVFYGGDSVDGPWTTLVTHTNDATLGAKNSTSYNFSDVTYKSKAFQYFKISFTIKDDQSSNFNIHQMELLELHGIYQYGITYMDGDTTLSLTPTTYLYGTGVSTLPTPSSKTGMTFAGWYDAKTGGNKVTSISSSEKGNKVLYARYTYNSYSITYKDKGGVAFSGTHASGYPTSHTYGTATTLKNPTKTNYTFDGWYKEIDCSGSKVTTIGAKDYTSNITLYAKWTLNLTNPTITSVGGYYKSDDTKKQIVMFGVTFEDYAKLSSGDTCGIYVYSDEGSTITATFSTTDISAIKADEGRFYCVFGENETIIENATYYAKGFIVTSGTTIYSPLASAEGNYNTQYYI